MEQNLPKNKEELEGLPISQRAKAAEAIGDIVGRIIQRSVNRANKLLKKYGFAVTATLNFHHLEDLEDSQPADAANNE